MMETLVFLGGHDLFFFLNDLIMYLIDRKTEENREKEIIMKNKSSMM